MSPLCIYCPREANAREHWLPRGLGNIKGATYLLQRICETCNKALGSEVDEEFLRTGLTGVRRVIEGVRGRSKERSVSPFYYRVGDAQPPTSLWIPSPKRSHKILAQAYRDELGRNAAKPLRQIVVRKNDGIECVPFPRGWTVQHLRDAIASRNLSGAELIEFYVDSDEDPQSEELRMFLSAVFGTFSADAYGGEGEITEEQAQLAVGLSHRYMRALAKVALHYALWADPTIDAKLPSFAALRDFVRWGAGDPWHFIRPLEQQFVPELAAGQRPDGPRHYLALRRRREAIDVFEQFFVTADEVPLPWDVRLALVDDADRLVAHEVRYYDDRSGECDGELTVLTGEIESRR